MSSIGYRYPWAYRLPYHMTIPPWLPHAPCPRSWRACCLDCVLLASLCQIVCVVSSPMRALLRFSLSGRRREPRYAWHGAARTRERRGRRERVTLAWLLSLLREYHTPPFMQALFSFIFDDAYRYIFFQCIPLCCSLTPTLLLKNRGGRVLRVGRGSSAYIWTVWIWVLFLKYNIIK